MTHGHSRGIRLKARLRLLKRAEALARIFRAHEYVLLIALAVLVGVVGGLGSILFGWLIGLSNSLFFVRFWGFLKENVPYGTYLIPIVPILGGAVVGPLVYFGAREAKGHGVPEVMTAVAVRGGVIRARVAVVKILASAICIGSGGSAGREGPIVQIGSTLGSALGQWLHLSTNRIKLLVGCGAAAGIAGTFNAPIAGALFAFEVILGSFSAEYFAPVIISSVVGAAVSRAYFGNYPAITVTHYTLNSPWELGLYALMGILVGVGAVLFIKSLYGAEDLFEKLKLPEPLKPALGGAALGATAIFFPQILGVGYEAMDLAFSAKLGIGLMAVLFAMKILGTSVTLGSGGSGGIFAPSLFIGSMFGGAFGGIANKLLPNIAATPTAYALVGMGAMVAGTTRAPITAIIIVFEMTDNYTIILPLMVAAVFGTVVSRILSPQTIYTEKIARKGIILEQGRDVGVLDSLYVKDVMRRDYESVPAHMRFGQFLKFLQNARQSCFPVLDRTGMLAGVLPLSRTRRWLAETALADVLVVSEMDIDDPVTVTVAETLLAATQKFDRLDVESIPVVAVDNPRYVVGLLFRDDVMNAYAAKTVGEVSDERK
jgi:CIC family chloride channel protein